MRLWNWIKDKYAKRRDERDDHDPWWVTLMLDIGRPIVAVLILVMCAPGEHYLAVQAGWTDTLAWGMPGTLTAYAGIAAVVATKRPKDAPGRKTAVTGAVISIALAMAAQPIAHLYGKVGLHPEQIALTVAAGLIPAAVFGHLLHMGAASPKRRRTVRPDKRTVKPDTPVPAWVTEEKARRTMSAGQPDNAADNTPDKAVTAPAGVRRTADGSMRTVARDYLTDNPDATDEEVSAHLLSRFGQDSKPNSVYVSVRRARKDLEKAG